jgi:hypothetical protein
LTNSGTITGGQGGTGGFEILHEDGTFTIDGTGAAGSGSGGVSITNGDLTDPTNIVLNSLNSLQASGEAMNFDPTLSYSWTVATATEGFLEFDDGYLLDTSGFYNNLAGGSFSLATNGNSLNLLFSPASVSGLASVPEPASFLLIAVAAAMFAMRYRRKPGRSRSGA